MQLDAHEITAVLPYLRRFARAATGRQSTGDIAVRVCLQRVAGNRRPFADGDDPRIALFRCLRQTWAGRPDAPPPERQALLLSSLEGFSFAEIGAILETDEAAARRLFNRAQAQIGALRPQRIMIIEDEPIIGLDLAEISEDMGHTVTGVVDNENAAAALAFVDQPNLILADVRLKHGDSGIRAVRGIAESADVPAIFITAFPEMLLTGAAVEPVFVIPKPYATETVQAAIFQAVAVRMVGSGSAAAAPAAPATLHL